jgi:hypothetical protein
MNPTTKIAALLRVAAKDSGASAHEAHTAASCAVNLARKHGLGHLVARALNAQAKAAARVVRDEGSIVVSDTTGTGRARRRWSPCPTSGSAPRRSTSSSGMASTTT